MDLGAPMAFSPLDRPRLRELLKAQKRAMLATLPRQSTFRDVERAEVEDIDRALGKLDSGAYGRCERCGGELASRRLEAAPAARRCVRCELAK